MSKIILFSNIKGGVGKTTLCAQFAEYLSMKGVHVVAVDADLQASLSRHRNRELEADPEQTVPWAIAPLNTLDSTRVKEAMNEYKERDGIVLIDCPGNLNDNNLAIIYAVADLVVIPMAYDVDTIDATGIFVAVIKQQSKARLVFVPNRKIRLARHWLEEVHRRTGGLHRCKRTRCCRLATHRGQETDRATPGQLGAEHSYPCSCSGYDSSLYGGTQKGTKQPLILIPLYNIK